LNLLPISEAILEIIIGHPPEKYCRGFSHVPLPAPRDLWDWESRESWAYRYKRYIDSRKGETVLTVNDLQSSNVGGLDVRTSRELARWCEELDEYGTVVSMAALLAAE
jgi:hypothetical protein